jgi:hypothetical protein
MANGTKVEHLIVEQTFSEPLSDEEHSDGARRLDDCLARHGARWLRSYLSTDHRRMICEFEAPDAEVVRISFRSAGVEFVRVWAAEVHALDTAQPAT